MKVIYLAKQRECLARHKVADGKIVRVVCEYDEPCPTRYEEEGELAKQSEYVKLGLKPVQLGAILGLLNWQRKTFPKVLEELEEAEKLLEQMSSGDPAIDTKVRVAVWHAKTKVKTLLESLEEYSSMIS